MLERVLRFALRQGYRRGLKGQSRVWMAVGAGAITVRALQRLSRIGASDTVREELEPGQTLVIAHLAKPS